MDVAFMQHAENEVDDDERCATQPGDEIAPSHQPSLSAGSTAHRGRGCMGTANTEDRRRYEGSQNPTVTAVAANSVAIGVGADPARVP
jgi:hypothetical protein